MKYIDKLQWENKPFVSTVLVIPLITGNIKVFNNMIRVLLVMLTLLILVEAK